MESKGITNESVKIRKGSKVKLVNAQSKYKQKVLNGVHVFDGANDEETILVTETGKCSGIRYIIKNKDVAFVCIN